MKLSEIKGEKAIEVIAGIIEPATEIMTDTEFRDVARSGNRPKAVSIALKNHKRAILDILAVLDGEDPSTYNPSVLSIPKKLLELFNDPELISLFMLPDQTVEASSSGLRSENIEGREA